MRTFRSKILCFSPKKLKHNKLKYKLKNNLNKKNKKEENVYVETKQIHNTTTTDDYKYKYVKFKVF